MIDPTLIDWATIVPAAMAPAAIAGPINYVGGRTGVITAFIAFLSYGSGSAGPLPFIEREQAV
jgi:hypothetical protein